jgi:signal transduction histidine kinase
MPLQQMISFVLNLIKKGIFRLFLILSGICSFSCSSPNSLEIPYATIPYQNEPVQKIWESVDTLSLNTGIINKGISKSPWWIYLKFNNEKPFAETYYLTVRNPHINTLEVYFNGDSIPEFVLGDRFPFQERPIANRDLIVPLAMSAGENREILLWVDKSGETLLLQPEILSEYEFFNNISRENLLMGFMIGWMLIMLVFACFTAVQLKEAGALFYALFIISILFWFISHWGIGFQFLWPEQTSWTGKSRPFFNLLTNVFFLLLLLNFFPPQRKNSKLVWLLKISIFLHLYLIWEVLTKNELEVPIVNKMIFLRLTFGFSIFLIFLVLIYLLRQIKLKVPYAGYYLAGISILVLSSILTQLHQSGLSLGLPSFMFDFGGAFALLGETIFITAAFASRTADLKREKENLMLKVVQKEKELADQLIEVQEQERTRIGRDLHDTLGGQLASIFLLTDKLSQEVPAAQNLQKLRSMLKESIKETRGLSHDLAPSHLNELGLQKVLQNRLRFLEENQGLSTNFYYQVDTKLSEQFALMIYRICGELLHNITKHAKASEIMLQIIQKDNILELIVEDNGVGMNKEETDKGIGLANIKNRVAYMKGKMIIDSNSHGTTIIIELPLELI